MPIHLYKKKNFDGGFIKVTSDLPDVKDKLGGRPSSLAMTLDTEKLLMFKNRDYDGGCLYRSGKQSIADLGDKDKGGKFGFGNSVASVRKTPFFVDVTVTVLKGPGGILPGRVALDSEIITFGRTMIETASELWRPFLIEFDDIDFVFRTDARRFDIKRTSFTAFPPGWKVNNRVNVFINNFIDPAYGFASLPWRGEAIVIAAAFSKDEPGLIPDDLAGLVMAHEFGHHIGLKHNSAGSDELNIMRDPNEPGSGAPIILQNVKNLTDDQVTDAHTCLSKSLARRRQRQDSAN